MTTESSKPRSHKRVAREPTQLMMDAGDQVYEDHAYRSLPLQRIWEAMYDAAPAPAREWSDAEVDAMADTVCDQYGLSAGWRLSFCNVVRDAVRAGLAAAPAAEPDEFADLRGPSTPRNLKPAAEPIPSWVCAKCKLPRVADEWQHRHACIKGGVCAQEAPAAEPRRDYYQGSGENEGRGKPNGWHTPEPIVECEMCHGSGTIMQSLMDGPEQKMRCHLCGGAGKRKLRQPAAAKGD